MGVDIGGTKTEVLVVDRESRERGQVRSGTVLSSPDAMVGGVVSSVRHALDQAQARPDQVVTMGVGVPGQVDRRTGEVRVAVNLGLRAYPLGTVLAEEFGVPTFLENDVRLAALGAFHYLQAADPVRHLAYLGIGTGVAAGLILDGQLYRGAQGMAGEIGHIVFEEDGEVCNCGQRGCLETILAGPGIARQAAEAGLAEQERTLSALYTRSKEGDSKAQTIVQRVERTLARAVQWLIMTYDVEKVVLGGGITSAGEGLRESVSRELSRLRALSELAQLMLPEGKVSVLPADFNAGTRGAIRMAQEAAATHRTRQAGGVP